MFAHSFHCINLLRAPLKKKLNTLNTLNKKYNNTESTQIYNATYSTSINDIHEYSYLHNTCSQKIHALPLLLYLSLSLCSCRCF